MTTPTWLRVLGVAALAEAVTGLVLLVYPRLPVRLILGVEPAGVAIMASRLAGAALIALGAACWPGRLPAAGLSRATFGMLTYSLLATVYLLYLAVQRGPRGPLLWPAAVLHAVLTFLLLRAWLGRNAQTRNAG